MDGQETERKLGEISDQLGWRTLWKTWIRDPVGFCVDFAKENDVDQSAGTMIDGESFEKDDALRDNPTKGVPPGLALEVDKYTEAFRYHQATPEQLDKLKNIRLHATAFAYAILEVCPACADRSAALRKVREAAMTANAAVVLQGRI